MKYLLLVNSDEKLWETVPAAEQERVIGEHFALVEDLRRRGQYLAGEALQPVSTAVTVRVQNGRAVTTDGPFAETKEQIGGFYLIEARDLNEAVALAARIPHAGSGSVEVRPVMEFPAGG